MKTLRDTRDWEREREWECTCACECECCVCVCERERERERETLKVAAATKTHRKPSAAAAQELLATFRSLLALFTPLLSLSSLSLFPFLKFDPNDSHVSFSFYLSLPTIPQVNEWANNFFTSVFTSKQRFFHLFTCFCFCRIRVRLLCLSLVGRGCCVSYAASCLAGDETCSPHIKNNNHSSRQPRLRPNRDIEIVQEKILIAAAGETIRKRWSNKLRGAFE